MTFRVCLIGCGKTKASSPMPARELYTGSLFRAARAYAERFDAWWIVSAKHGLLSPELVVAPYELRLPRGLEARDQWGVRVASELVRVCEPRLDDERSVVSQLEVVVLAGADYADPVSAHLSRLAIRHTRPLDGLQVGQRLAWFKRERARG